MIITTTPTVEGKEIVEYLGVVCGEAVIGINVLKDIMAGIRDIVGGRSKAYEQELEKGRAAAFDGIAKKARELGAEAVVGIDIDYESVGSGNMLMVSISGTAVVLK